MSKKYDYLIYNQIKKHKNHVSFHMPGHKASRPFAARFKSAKLDITELSYSDNLHTPDGVIAKAQRDIAKILGARASYITTDGSSSGVFALIYAAAKRGGKIIVPRNSHRSVYNACRVLGIEPVIVQGGDAGGIMLAPDPAEIEKLMGGDGGISAVIITSPDYYGNIAPLEEYSKITKKYGRLLLVDGAHGAHLAFEEGKKGYCGAFADIWVDGAHKTLPALTQGAIVNVADDANRAAVEEALAMFRTTSPSYPIMASVEYGVKYLANNPEVIKKTKSAAEKFKSDMRGLTFYEGGDWCKLLIDFKPKGINADMVLSRLEKRGIYAEMSDGRYLLLYISPVTRAKHFKKLGRELTSILNDPRLADTYREKRAAIPEADRTYSYLYALGQPCEYVPLEKAVGRMSAENVGITPPCIPVVVAGEIYTGAAINLLKRSSNVFGVEKGKVKVVKV